METATNHKLYFLDGTVTISGPVPTLLPSLLPRSQKESIWHREGKYIASVM